MRSLRSSMPTFLSLILSLAGAAACHGGTTVTDEGAQNSADLVEADCARNLERCMRLRADGHPLECDTTYEECLRAVEESAPPSPCEPGYARETSDGACVRVPMIGDVTVSAAGAVAGNDFTTCTISAGTSTCTTTLNAEPGVVNARYAVMLLEVGPVTGCMEGSLALEITWIQSVLSYIAGYPVSGHRHYRFQAHHCEGNEMTDIPVSDIFTVIGQCAPGSLWDPATHTCS